MHIHILRETSWINQSVRYELEISGVLWEEEEALHIAVQL